MIKSIFIIALVGAFISLILKERSTFFIDLLHNILSKNISNTASTKLFTNDELKLYNGVDKPELYLAVLGNIFDVSKGSKYYGSNKQYNYFVGRDASRSFVTGKFGENKASEEVADFDDQELRTINHWLKFYKKDYKRVGKLIGRYYNENGKLTTYGNLVRNLIKEAESKKDMEEFEKLKYPPCNVEWDAEIGTRVWCTNRSGGVKRDWAGFPRQLYEPGSESYRCACVCNESQEQGNIKEYEGCDAKSESCYVKT